jgi:hypothetical protein
MPSRYSGELEPRLVEIQGFPSLYAYQVELAKTYSDVYRLPPDLDSLLGGLTPASYRAIVTRAILGGHDPENVVLLAIAPREQNTLADFLLTERMCGVRTLAFDFRDDLQAEWAGHPNWFFRLSKFSLPYQRHPFVPHSEFLELENFVLKPLSFAGMGVAADPTRGEIDAIPADRRSQYLLQERVRFEPVIQTPFGLTDAEIRILYVWTDRMEPVTTIVRMGRGKMMGVNDNRDLQWVGASAGFRTVLY